MEVIHQNEVGYIGMCPCCGDIQMSMGNLVLSMTAQEFQEFCTHFDEIRKELHVNMTEDYFGSRYVVKTNIEGVFLSHSVREFERILELLDCAKVVMTCQAWVKIEE